MIDLFFFSGLPTAVMGLGKSGMAVAKALLAAGAEVWAWDDNEDRRAAAREAGIPLVDLYGVNWQEAPSLILSPGIPDRLPTPHPVAQAAREAGTEIISDIELLGRACRDARFIGITGTNGKSTTTALIGHIMALGGQEVQVGGNLGPSVMEFDSLDENGTYVLEMSSYALERTYSITFDVAVLLNISPDHLERHGGLEGYIAAKKNIFRRQTDPRAAVVGIDDPHARAIYEELAAAGDQRVFPVSGQKEAPGGVYVLDGVLYDDIDGAKVPALPMSEAPALVGSHNAQNAAAAYAACRAIGMHAAVIAACLRSFPGLAHRQERVERVDGVLFVNDSKATNADAAARALASYPSIYWIAGGQPKEGGLAGLEPYYGRVAQAFLIGEAAADFAAALEGKVKTQLCGDLANAVPAAFEAARERGEDAVVLLSPACASFDQFANFEARGEAFKALVKALPGDHESPDSEGTAA